MSATIQSTALAIARKEVGYTEQRVNRTKYWAELYPAFQGQAWCAAFVMWCYKHAGFDMRGHIPSPYYCPSIEQWAKKIGAWSTSTHNDGDLVLYGTGLAVHIGIVWRDEKATGKRAVEGNTSSGSSGSQANGGGVYVRYRSSWIRGYVRMDKVLDHYGAKAPAKPNAGKVTSGALAEDSRWGTDTSRELQERLKTIEPDLAVDGRMGAKSWTALEEYLDAPYKDGEISRQSYKATELGNGIVPKWWEYTGRHSKGSQAIAALQQKVGVTADGVAYEGTTLALQRLLNKDKTAFTKGH